MRAVAVASVGACSTQLTGTGETQICFDSTGVDTSARSMQHGDPWARTGWRCSWSAFRVAQHDPAAFAALEPDVDTSWHNTPARFAVGEANALTMQ